MGIRDNQHEAEDGKRGQSHRHAGDFVLGRHRSCRHQTAPGDEPPCEHDEQKEGRAPGVASGLPPPRPG